ncbi:hypothetical protein CA267_011525 [Alteromonas pelagimontana]|uniref:Uncharacterized protein n=1 Tax=Alteromonas pelagimontana TaxID=1858656 RepID=A0A6M4ME42_9ALTE|nr:DUF6445 family protein [Alteromonas pelagimontana]QJR81362.1 hypothetical protein CA267_011525 [Alteromonas pelagimontana]
MGSSMPERNAQPALPFINSAALWHVMKIGQERTRVILVDDFLTDLTALQHEAYTAQYDGEGGTYYPGIRAAMPTETTKAIMQACAGAISQTYQRPPTSHYHVYNGFYSVATTAPAALTPLQRIPHFDSVKDGDFAVMLYVNTGEFSGTGFYRHSSGFENISEARWPHFREARKQDATQAGEAKTGYFTGSDNAYTLMGSIAYRANRLVIYPASLLHSGLVKGRGDLAASPSSGRLTANLFVSVGG